MRRNVLKKVIKDDLAESSVLTYFFTALCVSVWILLALPDIYLSYQKITY